MLSKFVIGVTLSIFLIGTYLIWFSKRNIFNHLSIGLCVVAYIVPAFVIDFGDYVNEDIVNLYVSISLVGCLFYVAGLFLGNKWKSLLLVNTVMQFNYFDSIVSNEAGLKKIIRISSIIYIMSLIGIIISFMIMGFVPLFASDPYTAKFFKGQYQAPYQRIAFLYRTSRQLLEMLMPLKVVELFAKFDLKNAILVLTGVILIIVSLNRGPILDGILIAISIVVALKKKNTPFIIFLLIIISSFIIGSSIYYIIGTIYPDSFFGDLAKQNNIFEAIAYGAPDITDQLTFLKAFSDSGNHYTYGLTFIGGLIPFNFPWNPSVYTLTVLNGTNDISDIVSGGLRLPVSLWGYVSFGWIGVMLIPFTSGFLTGYIIKKVKRIVSNLSETPNSNIIFFFIQFAVVYVGSVFTNFYLLSIYALPGFLIYFVLMYYSKKQV